MNKKISLQIGITFFKQQQPPSIVVVLSVNWRIKAENFMVLKFWTRTFQPRTKTTQPKNLNICYFKIFESRGYAMHFATIHVFTVSWSQNMISPLYLPLDFSFFISEIAFQIISLILGLLSVPLNNDTFSLFYHCQPAGYSTTSMQNKGRKKKGKKETHLSPEFHPTALRR